MDQIADNCTFVDKLMVMRWTHFRQRKPRVAASRWSVGNSLSPVLLKKGWVGGAVVQTMIKGQAQSPQWRSTWDLPPQVTHGPLWWCLPSCWSMLWCSHWTEWPCKQSSAGVWTSHLMSSGTASSHAASFNLLARCWWSCPWWSRFLWSQTFKHWAKKQSITVDAQFRALFFCLVSNWMWSCSVFPSNAWRSNLWTGESNLWPLVLLLCCCIAVWSLIVVKWSVKLVGKDPKEWSLSPHVNAKSPRNENNAMGIQQTERFCHFSALVVLLPVWCWIVSSHAVWFHIMMKGLLEFVDCPDQLAFETQMLPIR